MYRFELKNGVKANIWLNEELIVHSCDNSKLIIEEDAELLAESRKLIVELFLPRSHSNYALLGIDFIACGDGKITINLDINNRNNERYQDAIALTFDTVIWGIMDEFEEGIILSIDRHRREHTLPSGIITYNISAYGEIGSSADMFRMVSDILLSLLICNEVNESLMVKMIQENIR